MAFQECLGYCNIKKFLFTLTAENGKYPGSLQNSKKIFSHIRFAKSC